MKPNLFLLFSLICLSSTSHSQIVGCKDMHTGKFEMVTETSGKTVIERTKTKQYETNNFIDVKSVFDIVWINSCTYELRNRKVLEGGGSSYQMKSTDVVTVEIIKIEGKKMTVRTTANFSDVVLESEVIRIN